MKKVEEMTENVKAKDVLKVCGAIGVMSFALMLILANPVLAADINSTLSNAQSTVQSAGSKIAIIFLVVVAIVSMKTRKWAAAIASLVLVLVMAVVIAIPDSFIQWATSTIQGLL